MTTQKLARTADVSSYALNPARSARPHKCSIGLAVVLLVGNSAPEIAVML
jgi:hypothetical protein